MSQKISLLTLSVLAAVALTAERFVTAGGNYATARQGALGVTTTSAASNALVPVDALGTTVVVAGGVFAKGASLAVGTAGKAVASESGDVIVAVALQAATADGDRVEVFLIPNATPVTGA